MRKWCSPMNPDRRTTGRVMKAVLELATLSASVGLIAMIPSLMGMSWSAIVHVLGGLSITTLLALLLLWFATLLAHTVVLAAALPGLSTRRALLLNLSGSAVSNVLPFGGAAGMGLGYVMARRWGISPASFASFTAISNLWNVVGKLVVGSGLLCGATMIGVQLPSALSGIFAIGSATVLVIVVGAALAMTPAGASRVVGTCLTRVINGALAWCRSARRVDVEAAICDARAITSDVVAKGWARLTFGILGYMFLQAMLLAACLGAAGAHAPWQAIAVAFGVERLLTIVPLTPGGSGLAELGSVAVLIGLGVEPVTAAAGVLLYRMFTFLLQIPVGGLSALVWFRFSRLRAGSQVALPSPVSYK
ncbi:MAG: hypothetical protein JWQ70_1532 [Aeromicrobium sp.]|nr:hypothetical protein [Aeromicrobium sp.]